MSERNYQPEPRVGAEDPTIEMPAIIEQSFGPHYGQTTEPEVFDMSAAPLGDTYPEGSNLQRRARRWVSVGVVAGLFATGGVLGWSARNGNLPIMEQQITVPSDQETPSPLLSPEPSPSASLTPATLPPTEVHALVPGAFTPTASPSPRLPIVVKVMPPVEADGPWLDTAPHGSEDRSDSGPDEDSHEYRNRADRQEDEVSDDDDESADRREHLDWTEGDLREQFEREFNKHWN